MEALESFTIFDEIDSTNNGRYSYQSTNFAPPLSSFASNSSHFALENQEPFFFHFPLMQFPQLSQQVDHMISISSDASQFVTTNVNANVQTAIQMATAQQQQQSIQQELQNQPLLNQIQQELQNRPLFQNQQYTFWQTSTSPPESSKKQAKTPRISSKANSAALPNVFINSSFPQTQTDQDLSPKISPLKKRNSDSEKDSDDDLEKGENQDKRLQRLLNHNLMEKKRQHSINSYIDELKALVPTCNEAKITKVTILQRCLAYMQRLLQTVDNLRAENLRLKNEARYNTDNPLVNTARKFKLLIYTEDQQAQMTPFRIDGTFSSMVQLTEFLEKIANFDSTRMQVLYSDPEFGEEMVLLTDIAHLPTKAKIYIRNTAQEVPIPVVIKSQNENISPVTSDDDSYDLYYPALSSSNNAVRLMALCVFSSALFALFGPNVENEGHTLTSRVLSGIFPDYSTWEFDDQLIALFGYILFFPKFFFLFGTFRFFWLCTAPNFDENVKKIRLEKCQRKKKLADKALREGEWFKSKVLYEEALQLLGYDSTWNKMFLYQIFTILFQSLVQHTHRFQYGIHQDRLAVYLRKEGLEISEASYLHHQLFKINYRYERKRLEFIISLLHALNYGEVSKETPKSLMAEIYFSMSVTMFGFLPWGTILFLASPGSYYKSLGSDALKKCSSNEALTIREWQEELERRDFPFSSLKFVSLLMIMIVIYEYWSGHQIVSILITGHMLFEVLLTIVQYFLNYLAPGIVSTANLYF